MVHLAGIVLLAGLEILIISVVENAVKEVTYAYLRDTVKQAFPQVTDVMLKEALAQMDRISYDTKTGIIQLKTR